MDDFPDELLVMVFGYLSDCSRIVAAFVSRRWSALLKADLAKVSDLRLSFEDGVCAVSPSVDRLGSGSFQLHVSLCQCAAHVQSHRRWLVDLLALIGPNVRQLIVEDSLLRADSFVAGESVDALLDACRRLECLQLHNVDLSRVSVGTLAKVGRLRQLGQLVLCQCEQRDVLASAASTARLDDRLLSALVCASRLSLRQLHVTDCPLLSDGFLRHVARSCPRLWFADFSGCAQVTARGVVHFCETLSQREPDVLYLRVGLTDIRGDQLQMYVHSPFSPIARQQWRIVNFHIELGERRKAAFLQSDALPQKSVVLFI